MTNSLFDPGHCCVDIALLMGNQSRQVQSIWMIREMMQDLLIYSNGFLQSTGLMMTGAYFQFCGYIHSAINSANVPDISLICITITRSPLLAWKTASVC